MEAIRAEHCLICDAARRAGLTFAEASEVWAYGYHEQKLRMHEGGPADRWIEEVT